VVDNALELLNNLIRFDRTAMGTMEPKDLQVLWKRYLFPPVIKGELSRSTSLAVRRGIAYRTSFFAFCPETLGYGIEGLVQNPELPFQITAEEYPHLGRVSKLRWTDGSWSLQSKKNGISMFLGRDANKRITKDLVCSMLWACTLPGELFR